MCGAEETDEYGRGAFGEQHVLYCRVHGHATRLGAAGGGVLSKRRVDASSRAAARTETSFEMPLEILNSFSSTFHPYACSKRTYTISAWGILSYAIRSPTKARFYPGRLASRLTFNLRS
jgi:hypothetical protein